MCSGEDRDVDGNARGVRFIQSNPEVSLSTQKKQDKDANVHQTNSTLMSKAKEVNNIKH